MLVLAAIGASFALVRQEGGRAQLERVEAIASSAEDVLALLRDAETGQRGFLLTGGRERYLEPYVAAMAGIHKELDTLRQRAGTLPPVRETDALRAHVAALTDLVPAKLDELAQTIDLHRRGEREAALALVETDAGKAVMDAIRAEVAGLRRVAADLRGSEAAALRASVLAGFGAAAVLGLVAVALLAAGWRARLRAERQAEEGRAALAASEARLRLATEGAGVGTWELDLVSRTGRWSRETATLLGAGREHQADADWVELVHVDDRARLRDAWRRAVRNGRPFEVEFRTVAPAPDGKDRWLLCRGRVDCDANGRPARAAGVLLDATGRIRAEQRQTLLAREVDHRAKNALAVVQAAMRLTPKDDPKAYAAAVEGRVAALARAHSLLAGGAWEGADLRAMLEGELEPFLSAGDSGRAELDGPRVVLPPYATQPLAMAIHELATNAVKHGALSVAGGRISVRWWLERANNPGERVLGLRWNEAGGPPLVGSPARRGFGTRVLEGTLRGQLGGAVTLHWAPTGLDCAIEVPLRHAGHHEQPRDLVRA
jgi:PAS domain S-box-containing protein